MKTRYSNSLSEAYLQIRQREGLANTDIQKLEKESYEIGTDEYKEYLKKLTPGEVEEHSNAKPHHHPHREDDDDKKEKGELATTDEARQLKDKKKEMMVKSKDSGVIVIDKKDFKKYQKKGYFAVEEVKLDEVFDFVLLDKDNKIAGRYSGSNAKKEAESGKKSAHLPPMRIPKNEVGKMKIVPISPKDKKGIGDTVLAIGEEVELDEVGGSAFGGTIDKIQKVVDDKQATKIDGVMVDTFTASLIMNIFNKVNKQNQDKMRKMKVTQLAKAAYKLAGVKEEVELDESAASDARRAMKKDPDMKQRAFSKDVSATDDDEKAASKNIIMQMRKAVSLKGRFDVEFQDGKKVKIPAKIAQEVQRKFSSLRRPQEKQKFQAKVAKSHKSMLAALRESFDSSPRKLVEGTWSLPDTPSKKNEFKKLMKKKIKLGHEGDDASKALGGLVGDDSLMDDLYAAGKKNPNDDARPIIKKHMKRLGIKEEVELDEGYEGEVVKVLKKAKIASYFSNGILYVERGDGKDAMAALKKAPNIKELPKVREEKPRRNESVDLEEGRMKELHSLIQQGKSAKEIAKTMKLDVKTIKALMNSYNADDDKYPEMLKAACAAGGGKDIVGAPLGLSFEPTGDMYIPEGEEEDRVKQKYKDDAEKSKSRREDDIERAKIADLRTAMQDKKREREKNQRNEVLDRIDSKLKERKNG